MKSFLSGRNQVSAPPLHALNEHSTKELTARISGHAHGDKKDLGSPTVECVRQGDKIVKLLVTCGCGERIEIECLY